MDTAQHLWRIGGEIRRLRRLRDRRRSSGAMGDADLVRQCEYTIGTLQGAESALRLLERARRLND
jgi:hypothetical protein